MNSEYWYLVCWETYLAVWKFFKKHKEKDPVDWEAVYQEAYEIRKKHPSKLCERLLIAMVSELERKEMCRRKGGTRG